MSDLVLDPTDSTGAWQLNEMYSLSDANPQDLSNEQIKPIKEYLLSDLYAFCVCIMEYKDLDQQLHGELCKFIELWGTPGYKRLMIQIPRDCFKTSVCTRANALWRICRDSDEPVVIFNERIDNAKLWLRAIKDVVQNSQLFQIVFQDLVPEGLMIGDKAAGKHLSKNWKWSDTEINLNRTAIGTPEACISVMGTGAASAGHHWPWVIKDDLISFEASQSLVSMQRAKEWFDSSLYCEKPAQKGNDLIACTPWHYDDLYRHILETYKTGELEYKLYRRSALELPDRTPSVEGESVFPSKWSTEELQQQYARNQYDFSAQMQCRPKPGREQSFDLDDVRYCAIREDDEGIWIRIDNDSYDTEVNPAGCPDTPPQELPMCWFHKVLLVDPAPSEASEKRQAGHKARNGLVMAAIDPWGRRFVLEALPLREDPYEVILDMFRLLRKWGSDTLGVEEVVFSTLYRHWITNILARDRSFMSHTDGYLRTIPLKPEKRSKDTRIHALIPGFKRHEWYFNKHETLPLLAEISEYPYCDTRDLLDALAYHDAVLRRPESPLEYDIRREDEHYQQAGGGRDPVTGY